MVNFRLLNADEIECRVSQCNAKGYSLLLYKDARCDMNILDETVGPMNWQRSHEVVNGKEFCTVALRESGADSWVAKQDCGTKSNTEAEKGESSDAFKRACVNWGIGRELYTSPFIWVNGGVKPHQTKKDTYVPEEKVQNFKVAQIEYDEKRRISGLVIVNEHGEPRYSFGKRVAGGKTGKKQTNEKRNSEITSEMVGQLLYMAEDVRVSMEKIMESYGVENLYHLSLKQYDNAIRTLKDMKNKKESVPDATLDDVLDTGV